MTHRLVPSLRRASIIIVAAAAPSLAQTGGGGDFHWTGSIATGSHVSVSNVNGDIHITSSGTGRAEVTGTKRGSGGDLLRANVEQTSRGLTICVLYDDDTSCNDRGSRSHNHNWNNASVTLDVSLPASVEVSVSSVSGDVRLSGAQGNVEASTVSGDLHLDKLNATSIRANSVSGDILVQADQLASSGDLSFHSVSGDITLEMPRQFDADVSMSTVSGGMDSDYQLTLATGRSSRRSLNARIGNGGRRLELSTVSGDVKLRMGSR
ncbi:MAG TPA: DUF4097 family beta strand repeat-containing protein [Gemmatimonadaceae bacterium]|jgi:DUF4097 and DUF4098 domain-containing protein YvlB|nr:DUF4097 family beta strand repeat-containing protein [Gemmatimonadaceae bacterium]